LGPKIPNQLQGPLDYVVAEDGGGGDGDVVGDADYSFELALMDSAVRSLNASSIE
jgi:hypothetical protein